VKANFRSGEIVKVIDKIEEGRSIVPHQKKVKYDGIGSKRFHVVTSHKIYNKGIVKLEKKFKGKKFNVADELGKLLEKAIKALWK